MAAKNHRPTRYAPDLGTLAQLHFGPTAEVVRDPIVALVVDVSRAGFKLVVVNFEAPVNGSPVFVAIGEQSFAKAELKWTKPLDPRVTMVGLEIRSEP